MRLKNIDIIHNQERCSETCLKRKWKGPKFFSAARRFLFTQVLKVWILGIVKVSAKDSFPLCIGSASDRFHFI